MVFGSDSIQVFTKQILKQQSLPKADSTQVKSVKKTVQKEPIFNQAPPQKKVQQPASQTNHSMPTVKSNPKPVVKQELSVTSANSQNDAGSLVGSFDTNLPTFKNLNMNNKVAVAEAGGVGVYGEGEVKVKHIDGNPPTESVVFPGQNVAITFPTPEPPVKGSIVYDAKSKTYAFNNIDGLNLTSKPKEGGGGENFLVNGGTVDHLDIGENVKSGSNKLPDYATKPQTVVLMNTVVKDGAITVANDRIIANKNTKMNTEKIHVNAQKDGDSRYYSSSLAYEGHDARSTSKMQTGYSISSAYTNWLGGDEKDLKTLRTTETLGTVNIDNDAFSAVNSIKNKAPARIIGNMNIYTTSGDGDDVRVEENKNGTVTMAFANKNTRLILPKEQAENAQLYYDRATNTLYVENLEDVSINKDLSNGHYDMDVNLVIKDCHFNYLDTSETTSSVGDMIAHKSTGKTQHSNVAILGNSRVDELYSTFDDIYLDENASVGIYAGIGNNTTDNLSQQNKVKRENQNPYDKKEQVYFKADLNGLQGRVRDAFAHGYTGQRRM